MKRVIGLGLMLIVANQQANAAIISVSGSGIEIAAPSVALDDFAFNNTSIVGFEEKQNVTLGVNVTHDSGVVAKGTNVSSHMIFLNQEPGKTSVLDRRAQFQFDGTILGVMSDKDGNLEWGSVFLGAVGTSYPSGGFSNRGFENNQDTYSGVGTDTLNVRMYVTQPGDWIRVITAAADGSNGVVTPEPTGIVLWSLGAAGLAFVRGRRKLA